MLVFQWKVYFSRRIFDEIMVEREGFAFKLEVVYKQLPNYCSYCHMIGHDVTTCRWLHPKQAVEKIDLGEKQVAVPKRTTQKYVEKHNPDGNGSSKPFEMTHIGNAELDVYQVEPLIPSADHDVTLMTHHAYRLIIATRYRRSYRIA